MLNSVKESIVVSKGNHFSLDASNKRLTFYDSSIVDFGLMVMSITDFEKSKHFRKIDQIS